MVLEGLEACEVGPPPPDGLDCELPALAGGSRGTPEILADATMAASDGRACEETLSGAGLWIASFNS